MYGAKCGVSDTTNTPSSLHFLLATLFHQNFIQAWVQHGHDGLPVRTGFPPEKLFEVYNLWFDNPSFQTEINLLSVESDMADLIIIIGDVPAGPLTTKLLKIPLECSTSGRKYEHGGRLGLVLFSSQQTEYSRRSSLNIYSDPGIVLKNVMLSMNIDQISEVPRTLSCKHLIKALVPYNHAGRRSNTEHILLSFQVKFQN